MFCKGSVRSGMMVFCFITSSSVLCQCLPHAVNCLRFCFWRRLWLFCLCMKYVGNRWTDLRQIHREDVFGHSLGRVWMWRSKVKGQGRQRQKRTFRPFSAACFACSLCLVKHLQPVVMVAQCNRADHYIFILFYSFFFFLSFFPRLISAVGDWMFTILWHMVWP